ncbi:TPA: SIR2 family protein [Staphylococcus aureus]|uniref:SIR2 family protein n=1 Tax=Staphylococcus aureus TaxID=1280 RepID=UPI00085CAB07|nr:SIR2 family protein [Staphylococcus aureus]SCR24160.1 USG protein [Staphylococcus aureus]SCR24516.1 USG protein [Staphylococcus aureus]SCR54525.1 USG protein [Staphylococcus aureus]SCR68694.1 USG protein [Staphylococcus aureus]SCR75744.1 USG protein [Staphylococcus aureus]
MKINEFISNYKNHPVLFVGTGISLRYLKNSHSWDSLLMKIMIDVGLEEEDYFDIKARNQFEGEYDYSKIGSEIERIFNERLANDRSGEFKWINDEFYKMMKDYNLNISRFKIYISHIFRNVSIKEDVAEELAVLKKARKNIGSIITTNYDCFLEEIFEFNPLIGNDILLSNPYGSLYKIHGCITKPQKIIVTEEDYIKFNNKYELIRAQLLSLFIHNPIIFLGYSVSDENIKRILDTIFAYVEPNTAQAEKIRKNFLLVEYEEGSTNNEVVEHDISLQNNKLIRINKLKTDNYISIYKELSNLNLPVSAMDIRKVQNIVKDIYSGGEIKVAITEDIDTLQNYEKILAIGSRKTITYDYQTTPELMINYFKIIEEDNKELLSIIDKLKIQSQQYFPIFAFSKINNKIAHAEELKKQQKNNLLGTLERISPKHKILFNSILDLIKSDHIAQSYKTNALIYNVYKRHISLEELKNYLLEFKSKETTDYRKLLCLYDYLNNK